MKEFKLSNNFLNFQENHAFQGWKCQYKSYDLLLFFYPILNCENRKPLVVGLQISQS